MKIIKPVAPELIVVSDVVPKETMWLWYPYIPMHAASLIFGPGGHGKSHITVDMAAKWSTGRPMPGQAEALKPQKILMLSAEDDLERVLTPRLIRAGADLTKIAVPKRPFTLDKQGMEFLRGYINSFSATIIFIDPLVTYIGPRVDLNKANETRAFTGGLHELANEKQSSIVIVGHSRKSRSDDTSEDYEKAMGSADFNNAVRSAMFVTKANDGTRIMRHAKANWGPFGDTLAFQFGDNGFEWLGALDEDGIVSDKPLAAMARRRNKAETWLKNELLAGPVRSNVVEELAKQAGFSMRTVNRVKPYVAESYMQMVDGKPVWYWKLLGDEGDDDEGSREISVQGLEEPGERPHVQGAASIRRGAGGRVGGRARGGARKAVPRVGIARHGGGEEDLPGGGVGDIVPALSNKERAAQLLAAMGERGLGNE
jgi:hypothetical protein